MDKSKKYLFIKADDYQKVARKATEKKRKLNLISKTRLLLMSKKFDIGLFFLFAIVINFKMCMPENATIKNPTDEALYTIIIGGILLIIAIFWLQAGMRRALRVLDILEYGIVTPGTVTGVGELKERNPFNFSGPNGLHRTITTWRFTCTFSNSTGKNAKCLVRSRHEDSLKKGDDVAIIYDPDLPANSLAVEALPSYIKTDPAMTAQ